jgi:hypothetical protein
MDRPADRTRQHRKEKTGKGRERSRKKRSGQEIKLIEEA